MIKLPLPPSPDGSPASGPPAETRQHGDALLREAGPGVLDFSVNLNPYGPCEPVVRAAREAPLDVYPEPTARLAREAWADALKTDPGRLVLGNGASELLWLIPRALLRPGQRVAILEPTFSETRAAALDAGMRVVCVPGDPRADYSHDLTAAAEVISGCAMAYLCEPNNPTGQAHGAEAIGRLAAACPDTWLVVDQSFLALSDRADECLHPYPANVLCVRSLTKEFSLPGLRVGYLWASRSVASALEARRSAWPTGAPVQAAATQAATQSDFVAHSWKRLRADRDWLAAGLRARGYRPLPSATSFQLLQVGDAAACTSWASGLASAGVVARDATSFGLPGHVRLAARPRPEAERLLGVVPAASVAPAELADSIAALAHPAPG